jgi:serine kinase of HPr protein (carbohydrate metabolism regulator)
VIAACPPSIAGLIELRGTGIVAWPSVEAHPDALRNLPGRLPEKIGFRRTTKCFDRSRHCASRHSVAG